MLYRIRVTRPDDPDGPITEYVRFFKDDLQAKGFGYGCGTALANECSDMVCFPYEVAQLNPVVIASTLPK